MDAWIHSFLAWVSLPEIGLPAIFVVSTLSATLIPGGSEWAVLGLLAVEPALFWPTMAVATAGNTLGGAISWWMGWGAHRAVDGIRHNATHLRALDWLERLGPKACLLSWLPIVGDPLTAVAGWLKLPFWPCMFYAAIGKFLRYVVMTSAALYWLAPAAGQ